MTDPENKRLRGTEDRDPSRGRPAYAGRREKERTFGSKRASPHLPPLHPPASANMGLWTVINVACPSGVQSGYIASTPGAPTGAAEKRGIAAAADRPKPGRGSSGQLAAHRDSTEQGIVPIISISPPAARILRCWYFGPGRFDLWPGTSPASCPRDGLEA